MLNIIKLILLNPVFIWLYRTCKSLVIMLLGNNIYIGSMAGISNTSFGSNIKIFENCFINNSSIGDFTYISMNGYINFVSIGKFCSIGPNVNIGLGTHPTNMISTHPAFFSTNKQCGVTFADKSYFSERNRTTIGNDVRIGANALIKDGVIIGNGAIIGAGSVVVKNIEPYSIVGGVPAKHIRYRFNETEIEKIQKTERRNKESTFLKKNFKQFHTFTEFNRMQSL